MKHETMSRNSPLPVKERTESGTNMFCKERDASETNVSETTLTVAGADSRE